MVVYQKRPRQTKRSLNPMDRSDDRIGGGDRQKQPQRQKIRQQFTIRTSVCNSIYGVESRSEKINVSKRALIRLWSLRDRDPELDSERRRVIWCREETTEDLAHTSNSILFNMFLMKYSDMCPNQTFRSKMAAVNRFIFIVTQWRTDETAYLKSKSKQFMLCKAKRQ